MKINLAYFSCKRDVELLKISIQSSFRQFNFNNVFIFSDPNDPLEENFDSEKIVVIQRNEGSEKLYGLSNIQDMHTCLRIAAQGCEYVLKKDSDILDCSDYAYDKLAEGRWDCYGAFPMARENIIPQRHFNGNAYFIKSEILEKFPNTFPDRVHDWAILNYPEDMVTSTICNTITENIKIDGTANYYDGKYLFDIFLSKVAAEPTREGIQQYGFAHCRSNLRIMQYLQNKLYGND